MASLHACNMSSIFIYVIEQQVCKLGQSKNVWIKISQPLLYSGQITMLISVLGSDDVFRACRQHTSSRQLHIFRFILPLLLLFQVVQVEWTCRARFSSEPAALQLRRSSRCAHYNRPCYAVYNPTVRLTCHRQYVPV